MRRIELSHQKNVRDLGGLVGFNQKKVKKGLVFRGGQLSKVNDEDIKIIESLHLTDIVDMRGHKEFKSHPDHKFENLKYHNWRPLKEGVKQGKQKYEDGNLLWFLGSDEGYEHMCNVYKEITTTSYGIRAYRKFFKLLQKNNKRVYFHCSQGKDRAGMGAYLFLIALGVSEADARADYLMSNEAMEEKIKALKIQLKEEKYFDQEYERSLRDVFSAKEEYLDAAIEAINSKFGSMENYIKNILKVDVEKFRKLYLED